MSTDDSISEDVSSSVGALSHCHVGPNGDGGKESETSLVSSEGTSASGLAGPEDGHIPTSRTPVDALDIRPLDITPACNKIRRLCLSTDEAFEQGKNLPFINPSPLETLRVLVQEIQSSGETDPEIWKDCEGRWLHLFQLVEKQYHEQILAQQEQYQCQIQLIQDEIKALVQLQNRQGSGQPTPVNAALIPSDPSPPEDLTGAPARYPLTSPSPPPPDRAPETSNSAVPGTEERLATVRSSGYGTLSVWESGLGQTLSPGDVHEVSPRKGKHPEWTCGLQEELPEVTGRIPQQSFSNETTPGTGESCPLSSQQRDFSANQPLTSWAQRQKLRLKKGRAGQTSPQVCDYYQEPLSPREPHRHTVALDQNQLTGLSSNVFPLRRSDSLLSEVSGLTYWRLNENEIYRPLPDSFDSGAYLLLQEVSMSLTPPQEPRLSLRQIYENKQKPEPKHTDWDGSGTSSPLSPQQALTLDPAVHMRQSERTSGVTSPSNISSPSFPVQAAHHLYPKHGTPGTPVSPDSVVECSANNPGDTDCSSNMSSFSPIKVQSPWAHPSQQSASRDKDQTPCSFTARVSEEEGSLTSTLKLKSTSGASQHVERSSLSGDPVALSLLRQNLREKHYRHVDDLRAYYESEIQTLREKLNLRDLPQDLEQSNQALRERCEHLERALAEAAGHIQELEGKNFTLEKKLVEWPERYAVAVATVKSLQQRLEESKRSGAEREASAARLESRVRQLEEAAQAACREARDKEVRREREYKMLQDLLGEYDSLKKVHVGVKNSLVSAEDKHHRANDQILELKRVISKLESQVKQLEHENQARSRHHAPRNSTQPSGAGLFHHPDLLPSPSKHQTEADPVSGLRSPRRLTDQSESGRRSPFAQTNQSNGYRRSPYLQCDQSAGSGGLVDSSGGGSNRRCSSPPDKLQSHPQEHGGGGGGCGLREAGRRDRSSNQTPMLRALIELEETRSTQSRAPWGGTQRTTVGLVERKHKEPIQEQVGADAYVDELVRGSAGPEQGAARAVRCRHDGPERASATPLRPPQRSFSPERASATPLRPQRSLSPERASATPLRPQRSFSPERASAAPLKPQRSLSPERASAQAALLRPQRSLSPEGHRSSSLPPHHSLPPATPTKRETLLMPLSARSSPKRCPTENYSTALGQLPRQQHLQKRLDVPLDQRRHSFHSASPRKRLHFTASRRDEDLLQSCSLSADFSGSVNPTDTNSQLGWVEQGAAHQGVVLGSGRELLDSCEELLLPARLHSLADAERLLDELTQEKLQIEAALSRIPGAGSRVSLQNRLDEVALENRLERVNRELGSIRMTLKRFHVLRSSANV